MQVSAYLKLSVAVAVATIALKTGAWWVTDSVSLLSDALESLVNLAGAMFALLMVTIAARPADDDHPYGHHKAEYFSSGFEGVLIFVAALAIVWAAVQRLSAPQPLEQPGLGPGAVGRQLGDERRAGLGHAAQGARAPVDGAGGRCAPPVHRRLDLGRRRARPAGRGRHRLALARPGGGHRRGRQHPARRRVAGPALGRRPDGPGAGAAGACRDRTNARRVQAPGVALRPCRHAPRRPAPLRRPAHAHARQPGRWAVRPPCAPRSSRP